MNKLILSTFTLLALLSCKETVKTVEIIKQSDCSTSIGSNCEQTDFTTIPAANLDLYMNFDTVFENYTQESMLIHIPDSNSIVSGDNKLKILFQSSNYSSATSIIKSKIVKDGADCLYNYIVLNLQMDEASPTNQPTEYEMSLPISASEWSNTDFIMLEVNGDNKKIAGVHISKYPKETPDLNH